LQQSPSTLQAAPSAEHMIAVLGTQCFVGGLVAIGMSKVHDAGVPVPLVQQSWLDVHTVAVERVELGTMHCGSTQ
jgi:hypothetical protein